MIKRFISKGILGIPDMDIELSDEKIIIIKGSNGSGKTSLLKQITHPMSSHDRFNRLKPGEDEGYIITYLTYKNIDYKIQHLYKKDRKSVKVLSYISKKINDKYVELVENGLPSKFSEVVRYELEYDKYMYDILNIGVSNKGIIEGTNIDRIEYLKKILKLDILDEIKSNVLDNIKEKNANYKYIKTKLEEFIPIDEMRKRVSEIKNESIKIDTAINIKNSELSKLESSYDNSSEIKEELVKYKGILNDFNSIASILSNKNITYNKYLDDFKENVQFIKNSISNINLRIDEINSEIIRIKVIDSSKTLKEKEELLKLIEDFNNKYKDKKYNINKIQKEMDYLLSLRKAIELSNVAIKGHAYDTIQRYIDKYSNPNDILKEKKLEIEEIKESINSNKEKLDKINLSTNLISKEVPSDCKITKCPLRVELDRQLKELDVYNVLNDSIKKESEYLITLNEEYESLKETVHVVSSIKEYFKDIDFKINLFKLDDIYDDIVDKLFYEKDYMDNEANKNALSKIESLLELENESGIKRKEKLLLDIEELKIKKDKYNKDIDIKKNEYKKINIKLSDLNSGNKPLYEIRDSLIPKVTSKIDELEKSIKSIEYNKMNINNIKNEISTLKERLQVITDEYYKLNTYISESVKYTKEFNEIDKDLNELGILREIINKKLPGRILENYLFEIANHVNSLLEDFLTIRFDIKEGIDIIINREGVERLSSDLSQGEKSILAMALLMAFKKNINWDIISLDEIDATLDETNKSKFIYMIREYSELVPNLSQIFIVTHTEFNDDGLDTKVINL